MTERRALGDSGLAIAPLVLGGNVFGSNGMGRAESFAVLDAFVDAGGTMIDTADIYANYLPGGRGGESETMIGAWLARRGRRDDVQIATKVGGAMAADASGLGAAHVAAAAEASLRRLGTDHIDLYFAHFDDEGVPQAETADAFDRLVQAGKVRAIGASNFAPARLTSALDLAEACGTARYAAVQPHYNLLERAIEADLLPLCAARGLGTVAYFALAQGYLTGKYRTADDLAQSRRGGGVRRYMAGRGPAVLAAMDAVAAERGLAHATIALAWVKAKPGITAPIASATSVAQLQEIVAALAVDLSAAELATLDQACG